MANTSTFDPAFAEWWDTRAEDFYKRETLFDVLADTRIEAKMKSGDKFHRQYYSSLPRTRNYTRYSDVVIQDTPLTDETLTINQTPIIGFAIDSIDELQSNYALASDLQEKILPRIGEYVDGHFLDLTRSAGLTYDDANLNPSTGTSGNGAALTSSNVYDLFVGVYTRLAKTVKKGLDNNFLFAAISNNVLQIIKQSVYGRNTEWGDGVGKNGMVGDFAGFKIHVTQSLPWTGFLALATQPTDGDTVTLTFNDDYGTTTVTYTFKTTLGTTAGNVLIGASADAARTNLVAAISNSSSLAASTVDGGGLYVSLNNAGLGITRSATATNNGSTGVTVNLMGMGAITAGETLTAAADTWVAAKQIEHQLFGARGCISLVMQKGITLETREEPKQLVTNFLPHALFGDAVWQDSKFRMVDVKVNASSYGAS